MKKEEDFVMGLSIYMACLREKKRYSTADRKSTRLNSSHMPKSRMPSSA